MWTAITREVSPALAQCELSFVERTPIDPPARTRNTMPDPDGFRRTQARRQAAGITVKTVDVSELQKAEGAVTCCSIVFRTGAAA